MKARIRIGSDTFEVEFRKSLKGTVVEVDGEAFEVEAKPDGVQVGGQMLHVAVAGHHVFVDGEPIPFQVEEVTGVGAAETGAGHASAKVRPPMSGKLESLRVKTGDQVAKGQVLFVLEAMKMQNEVKSPMSGVVTAIHIQPGAAMETSQIVLEIGPVS